MIESTIARGSVELKDREAAPALSTEESPAPPWRAMVERRAKRSSRPALDREAIVRAALGIIDTDGVDALSLRRLATSLGVTPMSLYWHVADKAELLELVGNAVLDEVVLPDPVGGWQEQLRGVHLAMFDAFLRHPNTTDILAGRARFGASGLAAFERILAILLGVGLTPARVFDAYQSLYLFTLGFMATANRSPEFLDAQRDGALYMQTLPAERYPSIRSVAPVIGQRPPRDRLEIGVDVVIDGIAARLGPAGAAA